jgi:hypothetical protein
VTDALRDYIAALGKFNRAAIVSRPLIIEVQATEQPELHYWLIELPSEIDASLEALPHTLAIALSEHQ